MNLDRRRFVKGLACFLGGLGAGVFSCSRTLAASAPAAQTAAEAGVAVAATSAVPFRIRAQVFEVIVRQAVAGAPWREICQGPMAAFSINEDDVQDEVVRRLFARCRRIPCCECGQHTSEYATFGQVNLQEELFRRGRRACNKGLQCECATCFQTRWDFWNRR